MIRLERATELIEALDRDRVPAKALGGIAIALRCPTALTPPLKRDFSDLDLITDARAKALLATRLTDAGYEEDRAFNAINGHRRLSYRGDLGHVDVFIGAFEMCHTLDLHKRLDIDRRTVSLADLVLSKLQIAEVNLKDVTDLAAVFADHPLADDDAGINVRYISKILSSDWPWWRTVTDNLAVLHEQVPGLGLPDTTASRVDRSLRDLLESLDSAPKSIRWKARARIGDRLPWREVPEEVQH